ncbi:MAG: hypothetical protein KA214_07545 [Neisseriaceae bacterium]|nr:hypothetical protein [Neisseriaceae bacterium]
MSLPEMPIWRGEDGQIVSCTEKIKVMTENLEELQQLAQDALEDAILMGCTETQVKDYLALLMQGLSNPY